MSGAARSSTGAGSSRVAVALGSNLGDRRSHLAFAVQRLAGPLTGLMVSRWRDTDPVGVGAGAPTFLNGIIVGSTALAPRELLDVLQTLERERGRRRPYPGAARTLDLDLVFYADRVIDQPGLRVPHPRFRERLFVLEPLAEVAGDWVDPETGLTVAELLRRLKALPPARGA